jgi:hypothetical protein
LLSGSGSDRYLIMIADHISLSHFFGCPHARLRAPAHMKKSVEDDLWSSAAAAMTRGDLSGKKMNITGSREREREREKQ